MSDDEAITGPPGISLLPDDVREQWHAESFTPRLGSRGLRLRPVELERQMQFVGLAASAGVRVVAGTDTPIRSSCPDRACTTSSSGWSAPD